jgi:small subunit ribosomal protein S13
MAYIFNKYISPNKTISSALAQIFGIGSKRALLIANFLCINPTKRFYKLHSNDLVKLSKYFSSTTTSANWRVGSNPKENQMPIASGTTLKKNIKANIDKKIKIKSYQGLRHKNKLPVRGQRTHTNAKTQKRMPGPKY